MCLHAHVFDKLWLKLTVKNPLFSPLGLETSFSFGPWVPELTPLWQNQIYGTQPGYFFGGAENRSLEAANNSCTPDIARVNQTPTFCFLRIISTKLSWTSPTSCTYSMSNHLSRIQQEVRQWQAHVAVIQPGEPPFNEPRLCLLCWIRKLRINFGVVCRCEESCVASFFC